MKKIVIAIDGYVATGKWTTALGVAKALGYMYLETGVMYRAVTLYAQRHGLLDASPEQKLAMMDDIHLDFSYNPATDHHDMILNWENVEAVIRKTELWLAMRPIVTDLGIRKELVKRQQACGREGGIVAEGRDIGTVVFPDAELKVFMVCDLDVRVERRYQQLIAQWISADKEKVRQETEQRDRTDYLGPHAVNYQHPDAKILDTTSLSTEEQIATVVGWAEEIIG